MEELIITKEFEEWCKEMGYDEEEVEEYEPFDRYGGADINWRNGIY